MDSYWIHGPYLPPAITKSSPVCSACPSPDNRLLLTAAAMASVKKPDGNGGGGVDEVLKPFHQRASEAEERLARLETVFAKKQGEPDISSHEFSSVIKDFTSKLEIAQNELNFEREKTTKEIQKLLSENAKLQYRISHLVRALREMDSSSPLNQGA